MRKTMKKMALATVISSMALCSAFAVSGLANAKAETQITIDTITSFNMMKGASVRLVSNDPGIRFSATMSIDEYEGLVKTYCAENIEFGTFIMAESYEEKVTSIADPSVYFGTTPTFGWYLEDQTTYVGGSTEILQMDSAVYEYTDEETNQTFMRVNGAVTNVLDENLMRDFVGISYVKVTEPATVDGEEDTVTYKMANLQEDRARTIVYLAQKAYEDPDYATHKTVLGDFVNDYITYYETQNGKKPTVNYTVDVYDHDKYVETLSGEEYTAQLNSTVEYEVPSENVEYLDEKASVLNSTALANDKTALKVVYNKTHTPISYSKAETTASWACACGFNQEISLKEYDDAILSFNTGSSNDAVGYMDKSHASVVIDKEIATIRISDFGGFNGATDRSTNGIRLNLSGGYSLGEIGEIKISVKQNVNGTPVTSGGVNYMNGNAWLKVWANREAYTDKLFSDGATTVTNAQLNAIALRSFQASAISASEYQTISISASQIAAIYETTGFTADTPLDVLSMAYTDGNATNRVANLIIDKIEIVTKAELATKINEELKFNSSENISLLWKQNGTVAIEDDGLGNSVAAISYSGYGGANTNNINSNTIRISMGSIFTLGQISEIKIRLKQNATAGTSTSMNSNIWINRNELAHDTTNANNSTINNGFVKQFNAGSLSATEYSTVTITYDNISAKYATNGLSDATVLNTIAFGFTASGGRLAYLHIDSIEIVLK